jgi:hypothetical protein
MHNRSTNCESLATPEGLGNGGVSNGNDLENYEMAQKILKYKARKAKNQRRYYQKYVQLSVSLLSSSRSATTVTRAYNKKWDGKGQLSELHIILVLQYFRFTGFIEIAFLQRTQWLLVCESETVTTIPPLASESTFTPPLSFPSLTLSSLCLVPSRQTLQSRAFARVLRQCKWYINTDAGFKGVDISRWQSQTTPCCRQSVGWMAIN